MKTYKGKEVEVRVKPHGSRLSHYCIEYREKKTFNWFNPWVSHCYTWSISRDFFDPHQPHLYERYEHALTVATELKANPELIDKLNEERWDKYNELCRELEKYRAGRNKSTVL